MDNFLPYQDLLRNPWIIEKYCLLISFSWEFDLLPLCFHQICILFHEKILLFSPKINWPKFIFIYILDKNCSCRYKIISFPHSFYLCNFACRTWLFLTNILLVKYPICLNKVAINSCKNEVQFVMHKLFLFQNFDA